MKNDNISGKTLTKNQRIFQELFISHNERFFLPLMEIRKLFGLPKIKKIGMALQVVIDKPKKEDWDRFSELKTQCKTNQLKFFEIFDKGERNEFYNRIDRILIDNNLGIEWRCSLYDLVISGLFIPPLYNLAIQSNAKDRSLNLKLNASTSLKDIKDAWGAIEKERIKVFGEISRRNLSKKSVKNIITLAKMERIQKKYPKLKGTGILEELYPQMANEELNAKKDKMMADNLRQIKSRATRKV